MTGEIGPDREQCAPLLGRGLLEMTVSVVDSQPAVTILCDCGGETQLVIELPEPFLEDVEVPVTCHQCATSHWMIFYAGGRDG